MHPMYSTLITLSYIVIMCYSCPFAGRQLSSAVSSSTTMAPAPSPVKAPASAPRTAAADQVEMVILVIPVGSLVPSCLKII